MLPVARVVDEIPYEESPLVNGAQKSAWDCVGNDFESPGQRESPNERRLGGRERLHLESRVEIRVGDAVTASTVTTKEKVVHVRRDLDPIRRPVRSQARYSWHGQRIRKI